MASISKQSKETQDRHRKMLVELLKRPENHECMDCRARNPTWASINLGVFVCIRCSGLHRQVGVHITQVRSCTMDLWEPNQIAFMQTMGNAKGKAIFEALLPADYGKPLESEDSQLVLQWIRTKYEKKRYYNPAGAASMPSTSAKSTTAPTTNATNAPSDGSDILAMAKARPRKPKTAKALEENAGGPASPPPESPVNFTFDQFMSPSVQSPRTQEGPTFEGTSAFGFIQQGAAPLATASPRDQPVAPPQAAGSAFAFLGHASPLQESDEPAPSSTTSAFAFIASPAAAGSPSCVQSQLDRSVPSLMEFGSAQTSQPPLIPGHFASPNVEAPDRGYVFDPFAHEQQHGSPSNASAPAPPSTVTAVEQQGQQQQLASPHSQETPTVPAAALPQDPQALLLAMQQQMAMIQQQLAAAAVASTQ